MTKNTNQKTLNSISVSLKETKEKEEAFIPEEAIVTMDEELSKITGKPIKRRGGIKIKGVPEKKIEEKIEKKEAVEKKIVKIPGKARLALEKKIVFSWKKAGLGAGVAVGIAAVGILGFWIYANLTVKIPPASRFLPKDSIIFLQWDLSKTSPDTAENMLPEIKQDSPIALQLIRKSLDSDSEVINWLKNPITLSLIPEGNNLKIGFLAPLGDESKAREYLSSNFSVTRKETYKKIELSSLNNEEVFGIQDKYLIIASLDTAKKIISTKQSWSGLNGDKAFKKISSVLFSDNIEVPLQFFASPKIFHLPSFQPLSHILSPSLISGLGLNINSTPSGYYLTGLVLHQQKGVTLLDKKPFDLRLDYMIPQDTAFYYEGSNFPQALTVWRMKTGKEEKLADFHRILTPLVSDETFLSSFSGNYALFTMPNRRDSTDIGMVFQVKEMEKLKEQVKNKESALIELASYVPTAGKPAISTFSDNIYKDVAIRYINLPSPEITIDYAFYEDKLLVAFSKLSMYHLIDAIKEKAGGISVQPLLQENVQKGNLSKNKVFGFLYDNLTNDPEFVKTILPWWPSPHNLKSLVINIPEATKDSARLEGFVLSQ